MLPIEPGLGAVEQGREYCRRCAWAQAYDALSLADGMTPLGVDDLELLAQAAYLTGRDAEYLGALARVHHACLAAGEGAHAARSAFWLGFRLALRGEAGRANGWFARARRALDGSGRHSVEEGYLLLPVAEQQLASGAVRAALATAVRATEMGEEFADPDLIAAALHQQGRIRLRQGQVAEGLALLDEAMVAVVAGELSPLVTGLVYCSVIEACQEVFALGRAREWTSSLARWCDEQPEMIAFTGVCRVHRAEILQLGGSWPAALDEARRARERAQGVNRWAEAAACYQQGEVHRLRGELETAEKAFRCASELGLEPQPGLALLRLAQGRTDAAVAAIRRVLRTATEGPQRTRVLPACVEILLAAGDAEEARHACGELEQAAERLDADPLRAMGAQAIGAVELAAGNALGALASLRRACRIWQELQVPYEAARARVLVAVACRALGDCEGGDLELEAATAVFERLGAAQPPVRLPAAAEHARPPPRHRLTARELQVLRLVAAGKTNRAIGVELSLSEKTIDRHVSNILAKLGVSSRTAATAYALQHELI
jgi:DNA-binding CsgD family transcriptional regulator